MFDHRVYRRTHCIHKNLQRVVFRLIQMVYIGDSLVCILCFAHTLETWAKSVSWLQGPVSHWIKLFSRLWNLYFFLKDVGGVAKVTSFTILEICHLIFFIWRVRISSNDSTVSILNPSCYGELKDICMLNWFKLIQTSVTPTASCNFYFCDTPVPKPNSLGTSYCSPHNVASCKF